MLRKTLNGVKLLVLAGVAFIVGAMAWAGVSGFLGGVLDSIGIVIPASQFLMLSPVAGVVVAGYTISVVD